jgi:hypothetical protein
LSFNKPTAFLIDQFGSQTRGNGVLDVLFRYTLLDSLIKGKSRNRGRKMRSVTYIRTRQTR